MMSMNDRNLYTNSINGGEGVLCENKPDNFLNAYKDQRITEYESGLEECKQ